ncbi:MAG: acetyl-CoA acetyltransferase [Candidatus Limnocylindria bacterium]
MAELGSRPVYVAGVAETPLGEVHDQSELSMAALAIREALGEAGLRLADVDGIFVNYMGEEGSVQVGEYLGVQPRYADSSDLGGAAFEAFVHHAMLAIAAGRCEVAVITFASRQRTRRQRRYEHASDPTTPSSQFHVPYGLMAPIGMYAMAAARHMHEFGTTSEQLAEVAVAARRWAQMNPKAWSRDPLSVDDVLASRMICSPLHRADCCLVTDGGGAVVLTGPEGAKSATKPLIRVLGAGESHIAWNITQMPDLTTWAGATAGREAFGMAGVTPQDVDVFEPYDAFTIVPIIALEDLGFCAKGEGGEFVAGGRLGPGGDLPSMTSGGGLSYNHPGAFGVQLLVELTRQLRGESGERQVQGARIGVAHGIGGFMSVGSTVILGTE